MTPIPFPLPAGRILPPTTAYAAGLLCELRPDLADAVRAAVLGDAALTALDVLTLARVDAGDEQGVNALGYLREIVHYGGNDPRALHGLADVLGVLPPCRVNGAIVRLPIGGVYSRDTPANPMTYYVSGLEGLRTPNEMVARYAAEWLTDYFRNGWEAVWRRKNWPGGALALRCLAPIHVHTVSIDADVRAAWAKAHLDALEGL